MCTTKYYFEAFPKDDGKPDSKPIEVFTFATVFLKGRKSHESFAVSVRMNGAQAILTFDFWDERLVAIETQLSTFQGVRPTLDGNLLKRLLRNIRREVPFYADKPGVHLVIKTYVTGLPCLLAACCSLQPDQPECQAALKNIDMLLQPVEA